MEPQREKMVFCLESRRGLG